MSTRLSIVNQVELKLKEISLVNKYNTNYSEIKYSDKTPTEYGKNGLYWRDGRGEGEFGKLGHSQIWIEVDGVLVETDKPAHILGTLAIEDLERCFKSIGVCGAIPTRWKSDKWIETQGITICRVYYAVLIKYKSN